MRKMSFVFACAAMLALATVATAQPTHLNLFFVNNCNQHPGDVPPNFNLPLGNPTLWIAPTDENTRLSTQFGVAPTVTNYDHGSLYVGMNVNCRADGIGNETVSSIGWNCHKVGAGPDATALSATGYTVFTQPGYGSGANTGAASGPWSSPSPNSPTLNAAGNLLVQNSRAVAVPSSTTDALWNGYNPNRDSGGGLGGCGAGGRRNVGGTNGSYLVGRLDMAAATTGDTRGHLPTNFSLFMQVGALKITRVYDPTAANGGAPENVSFGVTAAEPTVSGSSPGAESASADAVVTLLRKGDFGGHDANGGLIPVPDGRVNSDDIFFFNQVLVGVPPPTAQQIYTGDLGGHDANGGGVPIPDCVVNSDDIFWFNQALLVAGGP